MNLNLRQLPYQENNVFPQSDFMQNWSLLLKIVLLTDFNSDNVDYYA
jgi:hypothetical protein